MMKQSVCRSTCRDIAEIACQIKVFAMENRRQGYTTEVLMMVMIVLVVVMIIALMTLKIIASTKI